MLLSQLIKKRIYTGNSPRGIIVGITFSTKNHAVKHLLCASQERNDNQPQHLDFAVNVTAISAITDSVALTHVRPALPKTQTKLFLDLPVYSQDGIYLGKIADGELENYRLKTLRTDREITFSPSDIAVCRDAIFLRKPQTYPLGQRVPSPMLSQLQSEKTSVTKPLLQRAVRQGALIKLTLSLPPFSLLSYPEN